MLCSIERRRRMDSGSTTLSSLDARLVPTRVGPLASFPKPLSLRGAHLERIMRRKNTWEAQGLNKKHLDFLNKTFYNTQGT